MLILNDIRSPLASKADDQAESESGGEKSNGLNHGLSFNEKRSEQDQEDNGRAQAEQDQKRMISHG